MRITLKSFSAFIFFLYLFTNSAFPQHEKFKSFENYLDEYIANKKVPSISAGVLRNDKIIWLGVRGFADLENNVPATINSLYRIASISKSITAVAIMQLYEKGLLDIDKDARIYIPWFPQKKWKFTVRQLLNHTSGIRNYKEGEFNSKDFFSNTEEAAKVFSYDSLNYEPGTKYEYTSLAYSLLAGIIESVTKMNYEDYVKQNILLPVGITTTVVDKQNKIIQNRAKGYEKNSSRDFINAPLADLSIKVAGGGILSNSQDLLLFAKGLLDGKLIKQETLEMMLKRTKLKSGTIINYGLGFAVTYDNDSLKYFYHIGGGTGFTSMLFINPHENLATVHLVNIVDRNLELPAEELAKIELGLDYNFPTKNISDELMNDYKSAGIDSTIKTYKLIADSNTTEYNLNENELIFFSKDLIGLNKTADAIKYLKVLNEKSPKSFSVHVALADAYLKDNNKGLALKQYRLANQLNNKDSYVNKMIGQLSK